MDSSLSVSEVASRLGVPRSRVAAWCRQGACTARRDARGWRWLDQSEVDRLVTERGQVPEPHPEGWSRTELLVVAALSRAPRGFPSARGVAARVGVSPTSASAVLSRLEQAGLAQHVVEPRMWRGRARNQRVWYGRLLDPRFDRLLPYLHRVVLPSPPTPRQRGPLPDHLWHLAWNADPRQIDVERDAVYLAHRAITTGDPEAIAWAVEALPVDAVRRAARMRDVSPDAAAWVRASEHHHAAA